MVKKILDKIYYSRLFKEKRLENYKSGYNQGRFDYQMDMMNKSIINEELLEDTLWEHFGMHNTYYYYLTRTKEAFHIGTMNLDDFEELDEEFIGDLIDVIMDVVELSKGSNSNG